jgi:sterol desaturase/sphingolipid hydroxylase (fatty acid hydroxylase superfamily)
MGGAIRQSSLEHKSQRGGTLMNASSAPHSRLQLLVDYSIWPGLLVSAVAVAMVLQAFGVPNLLVTPLIVGPFVGAIAILERVHPERQEFLKMDLPLWMEATHFVFNFEFGYGLALLACEVVKRLLAGVVSLPPWPAHLPVPLQIFLAALLYEGTSYWQHRALHRFPSLWRFHLLHHGGTRMNFTRAVRFHFVDIGTAAFVAYLPLVVLETPDAVVTLLSVMLSIIGALQHANIRMRTPGWLDYLVCTPALHRFHHSKLTSESNHNFGNTVMVFDLLFGSFGQPLHPEGPAAIGVEGEQLPEGLRAQFFAPFQPAPTSAAPAVTSD